MAKANPTPERSEQRLRLAYALLIPAPLIFSVRAGMQIANGPDLPGFMLAIAGILSGAGMLLAIWATWHTNDRTKAIVAVTVALLGHYVVNRFIDPDLGGAMVYLGTGFLASLRVRWAQYAAMIAGVGALFRGEAADWIANGLLIIGAVGIAVALLMAARGKTQLP